MGISEARLRADMNNAGQNGTSDEPRGTPRKAMRTLGEIVVPGKDASIECLVLDLSTSGARLRITGVPRKAFEPAVTVPETFRLLIPRDNIALECKVAWREGDTLGVSLSSNFRPIRPAPGMGLQRKR